VIWKAIVEAVRSIHGVMDDPPPNVVIKSLGSASIDLLICAWVANAEQELPIQFKILEASKPLPQNLDRTIRKLSAF
jgi:small-conductance mechanosensitive channel